MCVWIRILGDVRFCTESLQHQIGLCIHKDTYLFMNLSYHTTFIIAHLKVFFLDICFVVGSIHEA